MNNSLKFKFKNEIPSLLLLIITIVASFFAYKYLPDSVVSHWNFAGEPDGWSSKNFQTYFFPALIAGIYLLMTFLPLIDPKKENYASFAKTYQTFKFLLVLALLIIYLAATAFNIGYPIAIAKVVSGTIGVLFVIMGLLMKNIKPNWFFGIRTPWTLSSPIVWEKTHKVGGQLFSVFGLIIIITPYLPMKIGVRLFIIGIALMIFGTFIYSYIAHRAEQKTKQQ